MDTTGTRWRRSSFSGGDGGNCVELAHANAVRDSKCPTATIGGDISSLVAAAKNGGLDRP
jgi:hypothetical protein